MSGFRVLVVAIVCLLASGCSQPPQPSPLLDGIMSYQSFAQLKTLPKMKNKKWKVIEDSSLAKVNKRPRFDTLRVETNYSHLGFSGTAVFRFYNAQLIQTWFYTHNVPKYKTALSNSFRSSGAKLDSSNSGYIKNTSIVFNKTCVVWRDDLFSQVG